MTSIDIKSINLYGNYNTDLIELTDSSCTISVAISILACFLVSARLFALTDSCFFGLGGSGALVSSFKGAGEGVVYFGAGDDSRIGLAGGGKRARLDG